MPSLLFDAAAVEMKRFLDDLGAETDSLGAL